MIKWLGCCFAVLMIFSFQNAQALEWTASTPPPNDVGLYAKPKTVVVKAPQPKKRRHHKPRVLRKSICESKYHGPRGLYVYYSLPAPACCGPMEGVKSRCCAQTGAFPSSDYATFNAGPEDLIYSATNDDDYRTSNNEDWSVVGDDSLDKLEW